MCVYVCACVRGKKIQLHKKKNGNNNISIKGGRARINYANVCRGRVTSLFSIRLTSTRLANGRRGRNGNIVIFKRHVSSELGSVNYCRGGHETRVTVHFWPPACYLNVFFN